GVVGALDREVTDTTQEVLDLGERAFRGLDDRDAVLGVARGDAETGGLSLETLRDGEAGRVIRGAVDAETARELLEALRDVVLRVGQVAVRVERRDVGCDLHSHSGSSVSGKCQNPSWVPEAAW